MAYVWAREGDDVVRFFFTQHGAMVEDPATGSACANLGGWFVATGTPLPVTRDAAPGRCGRAAVAARPARRRGTRIFVTGSVVELGSGSIEL